MSTTDRRGQLESLITGRRGCATRERFSPTIEMLGRTWRSLAASMSPRPAAKQDMPPRGSVDRARARFTLQECEKVIRIAA